MTAANQTDIAASAPPVSRRRILLVTGPPTQARDQLRRALPPGANLPWIGGPLDTGATALDLLGAELDGLVIDSDRGIDANRLGAAAGALRGGATLAWLVSESGSGAFVTRCQRMLATAPEVIHHDATGADSIPDALLEVLATATAPVHTPDADAAAGNADASACVSADQERAAAAVARCMAGRAGRPVVLQADRGRGKSAALGIGAARALAASTGEIIVTAAHATAVTNLLTHGHRCCRELGVATERLRHVALDALAELTTAPRGVIVDEAASVPVAMLRRLLERHTRIAFATTVHGYEGTGRGFELRFKADLDRMTPAWRALELTTPIRYPPGDPLEALIFRMLALDAEPVTPDPQFMLGSSDLAPERLDPAQLGADEPALRALFGLLIEAHYQTRPADLQRLLESAAVEVWRLGPSRAPLACAIAITEGGLDDELAQALVQGRRRPAGQLGAGILASQLGIADAARAQSLRISRIAVHASVRRLGLGRALVAAIAEDAARRGCDLLTSSFGATPELLEFWCGSGLELVRLGLQREAASGEHAALVCQPLSARGANIHDDARALLAAQLDTQLADALTDLDPEVTLACVARAPAPSAATALDVAATARWCAGEIGLEAIIGSAARVLRAALALPQATAMDAPRTAATRVLSAFAARVLQHQSWAQTARMLGVQGRAAAEARLRQYCTDLLSRIPAAAEPPR